LKISFLLNLSTNIIVWRQKILDSIKMFVGRGDVEGIIEADETFFLESFKAYKRGGQAKTSGIKGGKKKEGIDLIQHEKSLRNKYLNQ